MTEAVKVWYYREADTNPIIQTGACVSIDIDSDTAALLEAGHESNIDVFDTAEKYARYRKALHMLETYLDALESLQGHKYTFGSIRAYTH